MKKYWDLSFCQNQSERMKKRWKNKKYREKVVKAMRITWKNEELRKKMSKIRKKVQSTKEYRDNMSKALKKVCANPVYRKQMSEKAKEAYSRPEVRLRRKKAQEKMCKNPVYRKNMSIVLKKVKGELKSRKNMSRKFKKLWQNLEYQKMMAKARNIKPNKPEKYLNSLLNKLFPNEYKYVGDFQFWLGGKNPDFMNVNSQKKLIELFGDYWHRNDNPKNRIRYFKKYGYKTLVIWEHELKDGNKVINKLKMFHKKKWKI